MTMNTYEKCQTIRRYILCRAAEVMNYTNWSNDFAVGQIRKTPNCLLESLGKVNITELTIDQMDNLGFLRWSEEKPMRLIPLWLYPFLTDEIEAESISGEFITKKVDMNTDNRFGMLAYGILPKK